MKKATEVWIKCMELGAHYGCHQRADRSFFVCGYQFPVCSRCAGILFGKPIGLVISCKKNISFKTEMILMIPMFVDGLLQYFRIKESNNARRFLTGFLGGITLASFRISIIQIILKRKRIDFKMKQRF